MSAPPLTLCGVTVVVLLMSDALEMVLDLGMLEVPANEERRDTREGVSDCVENRFEDIAKKGQIWCGVSCLMVIQEKGTCSEVVVNDNADQPEVEVRKGVGVQRTE